MLAMKRIWIDKDQKTHEQWLDLMSVSDLNPTNERIEYAVGIYDRDKLVATGAYEGKILKCIAVCDDYKSENLLTQILVHLLDKMREQNKSHVLVYTKPENERIFNSLGFSKIISNNHVSFMEQGYPNFKDYERLLESKKVNKTASSIVMNANPFTKGHRYLVEQAASKSEHVYVFVVSEDISYFSTEDRIKMVELGLAHMTNVTVLPTEDYMVSLATFPSYFLKEDAQLKVAGIQADLDAQLFKDKIAPLMNIRKRFVGEEPYSQVTEVYNQAMKSVFGDSLQLEIIPRLAVNGDVISATKVRQAIQDKDYETLGKFLPDSSYNYLKEYNEL